MAVISHSQAPVSQSHWCWKGPVEITQSMPLLKQRQLEQVVHGHIQLGFLYLQPSLWVTCSSIQPPSEEETTHGVYQKVQRPPRRVITWLVQEGHCEGPTWSCVPSLNLGIWYKCGYSTNCPRNPNCWQQPAVHTNQKLLHSEVRLYPHQVCSMGQWPTFSIPNSPELQQLVRFWSQVLERAAAHSVVP